MWNDKLLKKTEAKRNTIGEKEAEGKLFEKMDTECLTILKKEVQ